MPPHRAKGDAIWLRSLLDAAPAALPPRQPTTGRGIMRQMAHLRMTATLRVWTAFLKPTGHSTTKSLIGWRRPFTKVASTLSSRRLMLKAVEEL